MDKSEQINELATALSKFQGEDIIVYKDTQGYGYKYAQFSQILSITKPFLSKHSMAVSQLCSCSDGKVIVDTVLMHSSGQWISSSLSMEVEQKKGLSVAQAIGATLTYAKRYGYCAIIGIEADKDTDAAHDKVDVNTGEIKADHTSSATNLEYLGALITAKEVSSKEISGWLSKGGVTKMSLLKPETIEALTKMLEKR